MTDTLPEEPDLHLEPRVIASTAEAVALLYAEETGVYEAPPSIRIPITKMDKWREIARNSPFLESQILGLANIMQKVRELKEHIAPVRMAELGMELLDRIVFKDQATQYFVTDIYLRRILSDDGQINPRASFRVSQVLQIREELGLQSERCSLSLEQVVRAAIVGILSPIARPASSNLP